MSGRRSNEGQVAGQRWAHSINPLLEMTTLVDLVNGPASAREKNEREESAEID